LLRRDRYDQLVDGGLRLVDRRLGRNLDVIPHLQERGDHHEDDQQHEHHVHQGRDVDVALVVAGSSGAHGHAMDSSRRYLIGAPCCFLSAMRPTFWKPASFVIFMTSLTSPYFRRWSALMIRSV